MSNIQLIATSPMGLEAVVARELRELGYSDLTVENGRVTFTGEELDICRANLWLRTAGKVLVKLGEFEARTFDELFEGTKALPWPQWLPKNAQFPVEGKSYKSQLSSVPACQGVVKKAIVEKMKEQYHREWFAEDGARYVIEVALSNDIATLTLDTSGDSLHKRGYRKHATEAPLRESLAAALVLLSRWSPERPLYDPFCGSGTIPIEAAMIGWNIAPGLRRTFAAEAWSRVSEEMWTEAKNEAYDALQDDIPLQLFGSDIDEAAIDIALASAKSAGLSDTIPFQVASIGDVRPDGYYGCIVTNPPYGERISEQAEVEHLVRQLGALHQQLDTWSTFVLNPLRNFEQNFKQKADKKRKLFNGRIACQLYQYFGPLPPRS